MNYVIFEQVSDLVNADFEWAQLSECSNDEVLGSNRIYRAQCSSLSFKAVKQYMSTLGLSDYSRDLVSDQLILRVNISKKVAFGASREMEGQVLKSIRSYSWSPLVIHNNPRKGWLLMSYHGQPELAPSEINMGDVLSVVAEMQQITDGPSFSYEALLLKYLSAFQKHNDQQYIEYVHHLDRLWCELPDVGSCLAHHDFHPGNVVKEGEALTLIDWEYSGIGNPWSDAASLVIKFGASVDSVYALPRFKVLPKEVFTKSLGVACEANRLLEKMWSRVRKLT